ncbi:XdhC family protein [Streptomyces spinoverrucosus]|uniref:XdhC family protein n=1 Tax=Streptomyces spinoverrucosus TaxID=284043 RepID=UPI00280BA1D1|nr:XdhC family protein [Streptomyces spinoverrucosus]
MCRLVSSLCPLRCISSRPDWVARRPGSRPLGATMAVADDDTWRGSLSGGCVEGIVLDMPRTVLAGGPRPR